MQDAARSFAAGDIVSTTGVLTRLDDQGRPVLRLSGVQIRLRPAVPPGGVDWRIDPIEGLDVGECDTGRAASLQLDVPLACANELFLLMCGRPGRRAEDAQPLDRPALDRLCQQGWGRTSGACGIELEVASRRGAGTRLRFRQVELQVDDGNPVAGFEVRRVGLRVQLHEDFLAPYAPLVGFAGSAART